MDTTVPADPLPLHFTCTPVGRTRRMRVLHHLLPPWQAYQAGAIAARHLHLYEILHEMHERRRYVLHITPHYDIEEARALLGPQVRRKEVERSLDEIQDIGLVEFSTERIRFPAPRRPPVCPALLPRCRVIDFPRRLLRYEGRCGSPGLFATTVGVLLRCTPHPEDGTLAGTIPAAWIANVMAMPERSVRRHLRTLQDLGWLCHVPRPCWYERSYGPWYAINLQWVAPLPATRATRPTQLALPLPTTHTPAPAANHDPVPPQVLPADICKKVSATPALSCEKVSARNTLSPCNDVDSFFSNSFPFQEVNHQIRTPPADPDPSPPAHNPDPDLSPPKTSGVVRKETREEPTTLQAPTLRHLVPEDLRDTERLMDLYGQATREGLIGSRPPDRLNFVGLATHALRVSTDNCCGLFKALLRRKAWDFITGADEDEALARLKAYDYAIVPQAWAQPPPAPVAVADPVTKDAQVVNAIVREHRGAISTERVLQYLVDEEGWTSARVRDVRARLAVWATGGTAHAPPTRLIEADEWPRDAPEDGDTTCAECAEWPCVCPLECPDDA
jgi:hypothetical protein